MLLKLTSFLKPAAYSTPKQGRPLLTYASSSITPEESASQNLSVDGSIMIGGSQMPQASSITGTRIISIFSGEVCAIVGLCNAGVIAGVI